MLRYAIRMLYCAALCLAETSCTLARSGLKYIRCVRSLYAVFVLFAVWCVVYYRLEKVGRLNKGRF
jgi:hypothetical protein